MKRNPKKFKKVLKTFKEISRHLKKLKQANKDMLLVGNTVTELMLKMDSYCAPEKTAVINKVIKHDH